MVGSGFETWEKPDGEFEAVPSPERLDYDQLEELAGELERAILHVLEATIDPRIHPQDRITIIGAALLKLGMIG